MAILDDRHYHKKSLIWVNLELEHVINHVLDLDCRDYKKSQKMTTMFPPFRTETCNKKKPKHHKDWPNIKLEHVIGHLVCLLGWQPLPKSTKSDYYVSTIQDRDLQQKNPENH